VLFGAEGAECPFVVQAVGEGYVNCVDGGIVEEGYGVGLVDYTVRI
jgi:hypothetical protein